VIGLGDPRQALPRLKLERVNQARLTDERFNVPSSFDPRKLLA
jgi:hypothetical protein